MEEIITTEPRSATDRLTVAERRTLTDPSTFAVIEENPCRYLVSSKTAFADFEVGIAYGRFIRVLSNTGGEYLWTVGERCPCPAAQHSERCKHESAALAAEGFRNVQEFKDTFLSHESPQGVLEFHRHRH